MREGRVYLLLLGILVIGILLGIRSCSVIASLEDQVGALKRVAAERDTLQKDADGMYHQAAAALENERQMRQQLEAEAPEKDRELRDLRARYNTSINTIAELEAIIAQGAAIESVFVEAPGDTIHQVSFEHVGPGIRIEGWTRTPPPRYQLKAEIEPIPFLIIVSQLRTGDWRADIQTEPWVKISKLETRVVPQSPSWWLKNRHLITFGVGVYLGIKLVKLLSDS